MYKRILVPIDGSDAAQGGLHEGIRLARASGGTLLLVHVVNELPLIAPEVTGVTLERVFDHLCEIGQAILRNAQEVVSAAGVACETRLIEAVGGPAGEQVVREASSWPAEAIVCGTHGRRGLRRVVMGSDAEYIVRHSPVPVLLIRAGIPAAA